MVFVDLHFALGLKFEDFTHDITKTLYTFFTIRIKMNDRKHIKKIDIKNFQQKNSKKNPTKIQKQPLTKSAFITQYV